TGHVRKQRSSSPATHPTSTPRPNLSSPDAVQAGHAGRALAIGDAHFASSGSTRSSLPRPSSFMLEKLVTQTAASLAAGIWQLAAQGNMYPAWPLLPRELPSAEQI